MDKAIFEFRLFLEELYELNKLRLKVKKLPNKKEVKKEQIDIERLFKDLNLFEKGYDKNYDYLVFNDFALLSKYLDKSMLSTKDILAVISYAIRFNTRPLSTKIKSYESSMTLEEHYRDAKEQQEQREKVKKERIRLASRMNKKERNKYAHDLLSNALHQGYTLFFHRVKQMENLDELVYECCYFNGIITKNPNYTEEDVETAISILDNILVCESIKDEIGDYLRDNIIEVIEEDIEEEEITPVIDLPKNYKKIETIEDVFKLKYLNEEAVRVLKKYVKQFFDLYNVEVIKVPNYEEFINCIMCLEKLETKRIEISRFISYNLMEIESVDNYLNNYNDLITLVHYLIKYKIKDIDIDSLIIKYKHLKPHYDNEIVEVINNLDKYSLYDETAANEIKELLYEMFITDDETYETIKELLNEYIQAFNKEELRTEYEYMQAQKIKSL